MNFFYQILLVFGGTFVAMGVLQYRRTPDVMDIVQEMARWSYVKVAVVVTIAYIVLYWVFQLLRFVL